MRVLCFRRCTLQVGLWRVVSCPATKTGGAGVGQSVVLLYAIVAWTHTFPFISLSMSKANPTSARHPYMYICPFGFGIREANVVS